MHVEQEKGKKRKRLDFLDILLQARDENGSSLTDEQIRVEMDTFMFAGHDTTASAISWALYNIARFPEYQRKCQEEVDGIWKDKEELDWEDINKLNYLTQCMKESMRLFAPVPMVSRSLEKTYEIDGRQVPEGTWAMTNIFCIHRNPLVWENPEKFDPSRFSPENVENRAPHAFVPFSSGPRNCIGQNFAYTEVKVALAKILRRFDLSVEPKNLVDLEDLFPELILRTKSGIHVNLKPRQAAV